MVKKIKSQSWRFNFSRIFLIVGLICLATSVGLVIYDRSASQFIGQIPEVQVQENSPDSITIPRLKLTLSLEQGYILDGKWTVSDNKATYLVAAGRPGTPTNTIIYGHNKWNIFGQLYKLKKGDEIIINVQGGQEFKYEVTDELTVKPGQLEYVYNHQIEELTLYTCTGLLDSQRLIIKALPKFD